MKQETEIEAKDETKSEPKAAKKKRAPIASPAAQRGLEVYAPELADALNLNAGKHRPALAVNIPVAKCVEDNENARRAFDESELEALAQSIRENGLQQPIHVVPRPNAENVEHYHVVQGNRRLRAFQKLGRLEIPAFVREDLADATEAAVAAAIENLQRVNLSPFEEARAYQRIRDAGKLTLEQVAERAGRSVGTVRNRLKILDLPEDLARRVGEPGFSTQHAEILLPLASKPGLLKVASEVIGTKDFSGEPLKVESFAREVESALVRAGVAAYESGGNDVHWEVAQRKSFQDKVGKLDHVTVGVGNRKRDLVVDVTALKEIAKQETEAWEKAQAKKKASGKAASVPDWRRKELDQQAVYSAARKRAKEAIGKAAKGVLQFGQRERGLVALALLRRANVSKHAALIADVSGLPVATIEKIDGYGMSEKQLVELVEQLNKKRDDGQQLARLLVAAALADRLEGVNAHSTSAGHVFDHAMKQWIGSTWQQLREKAKKEISAKRKDRKAAAKKSAKAKPVTTATAPDVEDDEDLDDGDDGEE